MRHADLPETTAAQRAALPLSNPVIRRLLQRKVMIDDRRRIIDRSARCCFWRMIGCGWIGCG
jgi:hypothetical protein